VTRYAYDSRGQVIRVWGDVPVPVRYQYDIHGRLWKLHTYRRDGNWNSGTWPAFAGEGDVTVWT